MLLQLFKIRSAATGAFSRVTRVKLPSFVAFLVVWVASAPTRHADSHACWMTTHRGAIKEANGVVFLVSPRKDSSL
jgi:hypothetical protein